MAVTISVEDYQTLASWAETYGVSQGTRQYAAIRDLTEKIERANGLTRYFLKCRWRDRTVRGNIPGETDWPPQLTTDLVRYTNPWTYDDVMAAIQARSPNPFEIEVTTDRTGTVGWTDIDRYFWRTL